MYETDLLVIATEEGEGTEIRRPIVRATSVVEQRVSHFLMGLALIGTMTGPLLIVLHTMPDALFAGVFFVVGVRLKFPLIHMQSPLLTASLFPRSGAQSSPMGFYRKLSFLCLKNDSFKVENRCSLFRAGR